MSDALVAETGAFLRSRAIVVPKGQAVTVRVRDAANEPVLAEALAGEEDVLVTGDDDRRVLGDSAGTRSLAPRQSRLLLRSGS